MATITAKVTTDSELINIVYTLTNEVFTTINVYPFYGDSSFSTKSQNGFTVMSIENAPSNSVEGQTGTFSVNIPASSFITAGVEFSGVHVLGITSTNNDIQSETFANILIGKTLDCCIADKVYKSLDCDCADDKCNEELLDAQKMFLFKQSAEYALRSISAAASLTDIKRIAILTDAKNKYTKAIELCTSGCGCDK